MMVSVGLGEYGAEASMSHLMTHASFKAALFLAAGVIIMSSGGNQHMGRYGGLTGSHCSLFCFCTLLVGCLCLMGLPETSGFYSKETIINLSYVFFNPLADYAHTLLVVAAFITCSYTVKLFIQSFFYDFNGLDYNIAPAAAGKNAHVLIAVAFTILIMDIIMKIWVGTNLLSGILFFVPWGVKNIPLLCLFAGFLTGTAAVGSKTFYIVRFCGTKWGFDQLYARTLVNITLDWSHITWAASDKGLFYINDQKVRI